MSEEDKNASMIEDDAVIETMELVEKSEPGNSTLQ